MSRSCQGHTVTLLLMSTHTKTFTTMDSQIGPKLSYKLKIVQVETEEEMSHNQVEKASKAISTDV